MFLLPKFSELQKTISHSQEVFRVIFLGAITLLFYKSFLYSGVMGSGNDAYWYHSIAADVIQQNQNGVFPVYVGQSLYNFSGIPMGRAPYFLLLVSFLNLITLHSLSSLEIQHLTIIVSALAASYIMYFTLASLAPRLRWAAFGFAIFYIATPGVITLINKMDMYFTFVACPFFPLLFYSLVRQYQKNDLFSYMLTSLALSLLWMSHPPTAFWSSVLCAFFCMLRLMFRPSVIPKLMLCVLFFILLNLWHFVMVFSLGMATQYSPSGPASSFVTSLADILKAGISNSFIPIDRDNFFYANYLQLGYTLWAVVLFSLIVAFQSRRQLLVFLLLDMMLLLLLLYPFSYQKLYLFWGYVPEFVRNITTAYPMQRFYIIIAALSCFVGMLSLATISPIQNKIFRFSVVGFFILGICWSAYQAYPIIKLSDNSRSPETSPHSWELQENIRFIGDYSTPNYKPSMLENIYDPALNNRLLDVTTGKPIKVFDNTEVVTEYCINNKKIVTHSNLNFPSRFNLPGSIPSNLMDFKIAPKTKYFLCLDLTISNTTGFFVVIGSKHLTLSAFKALNLAATHETLLIPVFTTENQMKNLDLLLSATANDNKPGFINVNSYGLIPYDVKQLPIKLQSLIPYHVTVNNPLKSAYLETARQFVPGYKLLINGKPQEVLRSPLGRVMTFLPYGKNDVVLVYEGTFAMMLAFYISALVWFVVIFYCINRGFKKLAN